MTKFSLLDLSPEKVEELYIKNNLRPLARVAQVSDGRCCVIGLILSDMKVDYFDRAGAYFEKISEFVVQDRLEIFPFATGFDSGLSGTYSAAKNDPLYLHGVKIGEHCRKIFGA